MDPSRFAAFLVVDLLLVMTLGADWAYAIAAGVRGRKVAPAVAGLAGGHLLHATLVVVGVGALLAQSQSVMELLTYLGAAYLLWLGTRERGADRDPELRDIAELADQLDAQLPAGLVVRRTSDQARRQGSRRRAR